tara:strand:- start:1642 stop:1815 length:174 start_codon:yes stop_codon:yes gene_type:complete
MTAKERYEICKACDAFNKNTKECRECGCFMPLKVVLPFIKCPLNKWLKTWGSNGDNI